MRGIKFSALKHIIFNVDSIEFTNDSYPKNNHWNTWGLLLFELSVPDTNIYKYNNKCQTNHYLKYITLITFNDKYNIKLYVNPFFLQRSLYEVGLRIVRQAAISRRFNYTIEAYLISVAEKYRNSYTPQNY